MHASKIKQLTKTQAAYFAGLLDGEGSVCIQRSKSKSKKWKYDYKVLVIIVNCNTEVIEWCKQVVGFGCAYTTRKNSYQENWNICHRYQITNENAKDLLRQISKYMIIKKELADMAILFPSDRTNSKAGRSQEQYECQTLIWEKAKELNKRGK
jgi:hypothetical protein